MSYGLSREKNYPRCRGHLSIPYSATLLFFSLLLIFIPAFAFAAEDYTYPVLEARDQEEFDLLTNNTYSADTEVIADDYSSAYDYDYSGDLAEETQNGIYDFSLPENGIPYSPVTGYEPGNNDYAKPVIKYFGRDIEPENLPFVYAEIPVRGKNIPVFFAYNNIEAIKYYEYVNGKYNTDTNTIVVNVENLANEAKEFWWKNKNLSPRQAAELRTEQLLRHESTHAYQNDLITDWQNKKYKPLSDAALSSGRTMADPKELAANEDKKNKIYYFGLDELGAFLSEEDTKVFQEKPKEILDRLEEKRLSTFTHSFASAAGEENLLDRLGYREFILQEELKNGELSAADIHKKYNEGKYYYGSGKRREDYYKKFYFSLTNEETKKAINELRDIFGHDMLPKVIPIPEEGILEIEKKMK